MKGKKFLTAAVAGLLSAVCAFGSGCSLFGIGGEGGTGNNGGGGNGGEGGDHEHNWVYNNTDADEHWEYATCHPTVTRNREAHVYDNDEDTTCNKCQHVREVQKPEEHEHSWVYDNTDADYHWQYASCHPEVNKKEDKKAHVYDNDEDTTCNVCGHVRETDIPNPPAHEHTWAYDNTDADYHWQYATCHPEVNKKEDKKAHEYDNDEDTTCNVCGHVREVIITPPAVAGEFIYKHAGDESAAFEWGDSAAANAKVEYKPSDGVSAYTAVDKQLITQKNSSTARVDILGLKKNTKYDFKITTSAGSTLTATGVKVTAYDRSGYAHFNYTSGVGAYNDDGTPKSNAVIVYVDESNKNTVTAKIGSKTYTGLVSILQNAGTSTPLIVRIKGTVGAATWNKLVENGDKALTPDEVVGVNGKKLVDFYSIDRSTKNPSTGKYEGGTSKDLPQATLIKDGFNTLDTSVYAELKGLNSKAKYDRTKDEFDSCWNDCQIQNVKNVTVEGVGEDARIFQWGMTFKNCNSIEVRNLTFEDYTEDACSFEGSQTSASSISDFKTGNIWVHNNTFEEGINYWDVCNEQDKHDGDGSTDFKGIKNVTLSYNVYRLTHKTGLIGGSNSHTTANVTFHHNWYDRCKSRLPLARQANMHMYNNYYNGATSCALSLRASAYAFVENCYFDTKSTATSVELQTDSTHGDGSAKLVNCINASGKFVNNSDANRFYNGSDRLATVTTSNKFENYKTNSKHFDVDSSIFYYDDATNSTKVDIDMLTAEEVKTQIPKIAGVMKREDNITGSGTTDPDPVDPTPDPTPDPVDPTPDPTTVNMTFIPEKDGVSGKTADGVTITVTGGAYKSTSAAVTIDGTAIAAGKAMKLNSSASVSIEVSAEVTLTAYVLLENLSVDGDTVTGTQASGGYYVITVTLAKGTHTVAKIANGSENQLYMLKITK